MKKQKKYKFYPHNDTIKHINSWLRTGSPHLSDKEVSTGIKELEHTRRVLLCMKEYFLATRLITQDLESLRDIYYMRSQKWKGDYNVR